MMRGEFFICRTDLNLLQNVKSRTDVTPVINLQVCFRPISSLFSVTMEPHRSLEKLKIASQTAAEC